MKTEKEIYVIRHGQTEHNKKGIVQGKGVNLPLNETGQAQARKFFDAYKEVPFDVVYTSTLLRAQETVADFLKLGIPHIIRPELDEISWGNFEGNAAVMEQSDAFKNLLTAWRNGELDQKPEGGESPLDLQKRQMPFIQEIQNSPHSKILVCMHGRAMRCLMCTLTNSPLTDMEKFEHVNLTLYKLSLSPLGEFSLKLNNHQDHLND